MTEAGAVCREVDENMSDIIEGVAPGDLFEHVATCERCRDARYDAEQMIVKLSDAGADYRCPEGLEARLMTALGAEVETPAKAAKAESHALAKVEKPSEQLANAEATSVAPHKRKSLRAHPDRAVPRQRWTWLSLAAALLLGIVWLGTRSAATGGGTAGLVAGAWHGKVLQVQRAFGSPSGLSQCRRGAEDCKPLAAGDAIPGGVALETDGLTRALVKFADGTVVALDRASRLELDPTERRRGQLLRGNLIAEVEKQLDTAGDEPSQRQRAALSHAVIDIPVGRAEVLGTKFALRAERDAARVEVSRGVVKLVDRQDRTVSVQAGEAGQIAMSAEPRVETVLDLGQAFGWPASAFDESLRQEPHGALGELTAKRPRDTDEMRGAVRLMEHHVKVRIVDNLARTEVEEVFTNQTDEVLEGIYRFPLPPGAQIERLALDVDGKLEEGAFVDRERAAAIWRGAVVNAGGKKPPPVEEIIWVPGPWKDPALLEWQRGNRFELRIFPIPRRASRRIVLAYTQVLAPSDGGRHYVYPLPEDPGGSTRVERFTFEAQVRGHDVARGVEGRGYALNTLSGSPDVARLAFEANGFSPIGDLGLVYQLASSEASLRAWAYQPSTLQVEAPSARRPFEDSGANVAADAPYVALAIRPLLPRRAQHESRDYVLLVDTSRSMIGESYRRAVAVARRTIREMDRLDRVTVLGCDSVCQSLPGGYLTPGDDTADAAGRFLEGIEPEGASDLAFAVEQAAALRGRDTGRVLRIVYVGDGTPTVGPIHPALIRRAVSDALPRGATLSAVAIGSDADQAALDVATDAGGGVTLPFSPGQSAEDVAYALLGATYGHTLQNARLTLPEGMVAVAPRDLGSIAAGSEQLVVARMLRPRIDGTAVLSGQVAGEAFEQRYPIEVVASTGQGNAFVPRLYAAVTIAELESSMAEGARRRSIELSTRFNVASRYTSMLVLESPAMFKAFGLDNQRTVAEWSGEQDSNKSETWGETPADDYADGDATAFEGGLGSAASPAKSSSSGSGSPRGALRAKKSANMDESSAEGRADWSGPPAPGVAPAPKPSAPATAAERSTPGWDPEPEPELRRRSGPFALPPPPPRQMVPMRRVWDRVGRIDVPALLDMTSASQRAALASRYREQSLSRSALKDAYVAYFLAGDLQPAAEMAELWSNKDPLDPDALTARADLAAQQGRREQAIRILGSVVDVRPADYKAQWRLARLHRWAGQPARGCRHSLAVAQLMLKDPKLVSEALACSREVGQITWVDDLLGALDPEVRREVQRLDPARRANEELSGDFRLQASWQGAKDDLDLVIVHPDGYRVSWLGAPTQSVITAMDVQSVHREGLALRGAAPGRYAIELVRSAPTLGPVRGSLEVRVGKTERSIPFVLEGDRVRVASADIRMQSRLVPIEGWVGTPPPGW